MSGPVIVWYRDDLRVDDHPALARAAECGRPVIAVYVLDDQTPGRWRAGGASRWWLHHSLAALSAVLERRGGKLAIRRGESVAALRELAIASGAVALYFNRRYEPHECALEERVHAALGDDLVIHQFRARLLFEPEVVSNAGGDPFRVFTPFWKACLRLPEPSAPIAAPAKIEPADIPGRSLALDELGLLPTRPDWAGGLREAWRPGEHGAGEAMERFLEETARRYVDQRDLPGTPGTSRLSPHLHFGEVSPCTLWHAIRDGQRADSRLTRGGDAWLRELGWREFCHHLLFHWPEITGKPFNHRFANFPWRDDADAFERWCRGRTGYPLVDAGMRELWHTGWMHNRVRMVAASFLVKHLLVPWWRGAAWFQDTLVDADLANNTCGWQWVAGCGADAAPYFRIFNPVLQGRKFDPGGDYVRRWIPELATLPDTHLHAPFEMPEQALRRHGVRLGEDYPEPIVDHAFARRRALDALAETR